MSFDTIVSGDMGRSFGADAGPGPGPGPLKYFSSVLLGLPGETLTGGRPPANILMYVFVAAITAAAAALVVS